MFTFVIFLLTALIKTKSVIEYENYVFAFCNGVDWYYYDVFVVLSIKSSGLILHF